MKNAIIIIINHKNNFLPLRNDSGVGFNTYLLMEGILFED